MIERNAGLPPERRIEFRVGIHLGHVVEEADGDLTGHGVTSLRDWRASPSPARLASPTGRSAGQRSARLGRDRSRPHRAQEHRRAGRVHALHIGVPAGRRSRPSAAHQAASGDAGRGHRGVDRDRVVGAYFISANRTATVGSTAATPAEPARLSIVVLPFTNLSNDPNQDYFADGITENLTTELSRIHNSFVIAPYRLQLQRQERQRQDIGKELGVRYVLEGSVQRDGPACASTPSSSIRARARIFGPTVSRRTSPTCSSSRIRWWRDYQ